MAQTSTGWSNTPQFMVTLSAISCYTDEGLYNNKTLSDARSVWLRDVLQSNQVSSKLNIDGITDLLISINRLH